eukprot:14336720-Alexandrium_andersonii.AAC.1
MRLRTGCPGQPGDSYKATTPSSAQRLWARRAGPPMGRGGARLGGPTPLRLPGSPGDGASMPLQET